MATIQKDSIRALEWPKFIQLAGECALTVPGKNGIESLLASENWATDLAHARLLQQETQEIIPLLDRDALWGPLAELEDPTSALDRLGRGAILEIVDLGLLRKWIYAVESWTQVPREEIHGLRLKTAILNLAEPFQPLRVLEKVLTPEGELSEKASPKLFSLSTEIRALKKEISAVLDHLIKTFSQKGVLQENFTDVRDGRYVIPVKISSQGEVDGIIYEASASRQTVFVEPKEVAALNNRLRQRQNDFTQEVFVILTEVSKQLQPYGPELFGSFNILIHWDQVHARARIGRRYSGKAIQVTEDRTFIMHQTAHPLLWWQLPQEQIIRNEIDFGDGALTLLLTGPNTGGKTVLMKTLGLAGICARTGFPFPAIDTPQVPFFDSFFADLGDPQSMEDHLSTFAGHILRFKETLESVNEKSLVLIDELNTATDPEEGAALGRAFLETVMEQGAIIICTTHDPHLKALAISDRRILNASMAFDETARTPTYRIVLGVPGRSRALETAERLGLPQRILDLAKRYVSREHIEFETVLSQLESNLQETTRAKKEAVSIREEAEKLKREWTEKTNLAVNEMMDKTRQKLRRIMEQAQDEVRTSVKKLDELRSRKDIDQTRGKISETFSLTNSRLESAVSEEMPEVAEALAIHRPEVTDTSLLKPGVQVRIPKWKSVGSILEIKGSKAKVSMGNIQMTLEISDIEPLTLGELGTNTGPKLQSLQPPKKSYQMESVAIPPSQIDLRGERLDVAMSRLEQYLDQAFRSGGLAEVTVVHGLGSGALREGARKILKGLPYIKNYQDGGVGRGGAGATIVEFER